MGRLHGSLVLVLVRVVQSWVASGASSERKSSATPAKTRSPAGLATCTPHTPHSPRAALTSNDDESTARDRKAVCVMGQRGLRTTMQRAGEYPTMVQECGLGMAYNLTAACGAFISGRGRLESVWPRGPGTSDGHDHEGSLASTSISTTSTISASSRPRTSGACPDCAASLSVLLHMLLRTA